MAREERLRQNLSGIETPMRTQDPHKDCPHALKVKRGGTTLVGPNLKDAGAWHGRWRRVSSGPRARSNPVAQVSSASGEEARDT